MRSDLEPAAELLSVGMLQWRNALLISRRFDDIAILLNNNALNNNVMDLTDSSERIPDLLYLESRHLAWLFNFCQIKI